MIKRLTWYGLIAAACYILIMAGCVTAPPKNPSNICSIFRQYPDWYWSTLRVRQRWGVPIPVQMAVMHQESSFQATAKPPRTKLLWLIPWRRPSSAYGFSQALDSTWRHYQVHTGQRGAARETFADADDFIGWYANRAYERAGIAKNNARNLYLAYHEGIGGFTTRSYLAKPWLIRVANNVAVRAAIYNRQLQACEDSLPKKPWWRFG